MTGAAGRAGALRALLFDKDGTLFDFNATWAVVVERVIAGMAPSAAAFRAMAEVAGFDADTRRFRAGSAIVAGATAETAHLWAPHLPGLTPAEIEARINRASAEMTSAETLVPAAPDLPGFLAGLRRAGYALGVATHDSEEGARAQLSAVGALEAFDFVAGYDSGHGLKPGPGMLHAFAVRTGIPPAGIAMVGDSVHDLMMVRTAGAALAVGVLTGPATAEDLADHADHVLPSITELPALLARLRPAA